ncbi:trifunctional MMPL family transporter/lysophospholipid acyltransferase/class I SAM-dependent methyltransferase [Mucilaginibacter celer]|uniref:Methyltransferase domain-containing protein n=1 Tax=Mucilaginibacter celer TaxID=2305508 RepID=A0A494VQZ7_9SPHI|nr:trifunctional MMPL family transporter/lysophospholipid acyltransferase/class I SAM-dependent methyltransferase [Mucilaginibacter celer]AYL98016.1 methyltransferase domain-containing protein [Mucilaginibacter celer]
MEKILIGIYNYFNARKPLFYVVFAASFLFVGFFASRIKFEEDISKVLPKDKKIEKLNYIFQNSKFVEKLVVMVSLKDTTRQEPDSLIAYADNFTATVQQKLPGYIGKINAKVDDGLVMQLFSTINKNLPIYLSERDYKDIDTLIHPDKVKETLARDLRTLTSPAGLALKSMISADPVGISYLGLKKLQQLQYDENFELYDSYVMTKNHKNLLLFITPKYSPNNTGENAVMLKGIDSIIDSLQAKHFKTINCSYFGTTAVSVGNALQLRRDSMFTQGITVVFLIVFLGFYFRKKRAPVVILVPVLFGALFSLAVVYFVKGSISVIALGTGSVVLGIAVNYSLHVFNHYRHTRSIEQVIRDLAMPLTVGSFTTIGGFFCLEFVESEMLKDLGLFAAFSLIGASFCSLIFLPHFIASQKEQDEHIAKLSWIDKLSAYNPEYNKFIITGIVILTVVFSYTARNVSFETDMTRMNFMTDKLKASEAKLNAINKYALQSVYLLVEGKTLDGALRTNEKLSAQIEQLKEKNIVKKYSGVSSLIISDSLQQARITRWNNYWTPAKKQQLIAVLLKEGAALGFKPSAFDHFKQLINKDFRPVGQDEMAGIRTSLLDDYITERPGRAGVITLVKISPEDKTKLYNLFDDMPNVTVVDKQYLTNRFVGIINNDFASIAIMSSLLVFTVLLLTYGRIELTLVSFIPMFISWIWILGLMGLLGIQFNIVNIIISALIFGLGDDYSLFIMDGLLQEYKTGKKNLSSYKSSIFLSAITTVAGLGVLIFAKHPALRSIALISIIGIVCVVVMAQILIPFLFNLLIRNRVRKKQFPWTLSGFVISVFAFTYFVSGCLLSSFIGLFLIKLNPFKGRRSKYVYHVILSKFCWSMMYIMPNIRKRVVDKDPFEKPAVVISNHQSFLDILTLVMQHPKLILFTNHWVWNSPVFGAVVRMAGYFPVAEGVEQNVHELAEKVKQGYSMVIFPEGSRSPDGKMKRFHKGAFFLAEQLGMDILPIMLHGTGYNMTKGDFLLKNGTITIKYLPRIKADDTSFGIGYAERTKNINRYFKQEYQKLSDQIEQPAYFNEQLFYNYLYKGPVLEWYMRIKVRLEKNYQVFHNLLPKQGKMLDLGCGYGFMPYMLHFAAPEREFTGVDYDEEKIEVASNCFSKTDDINFVYADALQFEMQQYDAIIMADMLHYLQPDRQTHLIEKCITALNPGGKLIIRDGDADLQQRQKGTALTEVFSTRILGFNKTVDKGLSFISGRALKEIAAVHGLQCNQIDNSRYTSNIIFVMTKEGKPQ